MSSGFNIQSLLDYTKEKRLSLFPYNFNVHKRFSNELNIY